MQNKATLFSQVPDQSQETAYDTSGNKGGFATSLPVHHPVTTARTESEKLNTLVRRSQRILVQISSVFPFDFFPDTVIVDENKVDIVQRVFFWSQEMYSVLIKSVTNCTIISNPFFATLNLEITGYEANPPAVKYLWKKDAYRARRVIMGLVACEKEKIDVTKLGDTELVQKVEEIGRAYKGDK